MILTTERQLIQKAAQRRVIWVTAREYSKRHNIHLCTLGNWRFRDLQAGRSSAPDGYPEYRRFGRAIRYRVELLEGEE